MSNINVEILKYFWIIPKEWQVPNQPHGWSLVNWCLTSYFEYYYFEAAFIIGEV